MSQGGFDFEQLRKLLEQMGLNPEGMGVDLQRMMQQMQQAPGFVFGFSPADQDPDAAWRTTITAAMHEVEKAGADPALTDQERIAVDDAERLAQTWLNEATTFSETGSMVRTLRRRQWLEETSQAWREIIEPIIEGLGKALERGADLGTEDDQLGALTSMLSPMMRNSASMLYRDRLRRVLAHVATHTLTGNELGINLFTEPGVAVLPSNVAEFTGDLDLAPADVVLYVLLREAARQRLFHHVPWLTTQVNALLAHYAREIQIDFNAIATEFDPSNMTELSVEDLMEMGERVRGSFFRPASTPVQLEILERLELLIALVEGWVDHVSNLAASAWMSQEPQLAELIRRRRAPGGPLASVFQDLLGLELRPRLIRDAQNFWAALDHHRSQTERDQVWQHPDVLPTTEQIKDPESYLESREKPETQEDEMDRELRELLDEPRDS